MRTLRFNRDLTVGESHIVLTDRGLFWQVTGTGFDHTGQETVRIEDTHDRDLPTVIVAGMVKSLNTKLATF